MQQKKQCKRCGIGKLPAAAPLANPYVPFQVEDPALYAPRTALIRGTLYQGLDLPFMGKVNTKEKPITPMSELQTLSFVIQELALYLDTHRNDKDALAMYRSFQMMYEKAKAQYELKCGPLTHMSQVNGEFRWLDDPWPWEYAKNREG